MLAQSTQWSPLEYLFVIFLVFVGISMTVGLLVPHSGVRGGCLGSLLKLAILGSGAAVLAHPVGVPFVTGIPGLSSRQEAFVLTAAAPLVALCIAWWFGPYAPGGPALTIVVRAVALFGACLLTALLADRAGLPVMTDAGAGAGIALLTMLMCRVAWRFSDEFETSQLLVRAGIVVAVAAGVGVVARANDVRLGSANGAAPWATFLLVALLAFAGFLLCVVGVRLLDRVVPERLLPPARWRPADRRRGDMWPPEPGQVWNAYVPFEEDETEMKDRPVLVLENHGDRIDVMKITSQDKSRFDNYLFLPYRKWHRVLAKDSWLELKVTELPTENFRSYRGECLRDVWREVRGAELPRRAKRATSRPPARPPAPRLGGVAGPGGGARLRSLVRRLASGQRERDRS
ncbi:MAG: hypothetical protein AUI14_25675 [Actinobacteria bacterium 13_2_20CM_2_71_6]|nr:MAG: hypothetical protein AUI14_25675 [Actinobacteria bacterium 13_2_20CM_2_71_6]